jgi:hypothetical protein
MTNKNIAKVLGEKEKAVNKLEKKAHIKLKQKKIFIIII